MATKSKQTHAGETPPANASKGERNEYAASLAKVKRETRLCRLANQLDDELRNSPQDAEAPAREAMASVCQLLSKAASDSALEFVQLASDVLGKSPADDNALLADVLRMIRE